MEISLLFRWCYRLTATEVCVLDTSSWSMDWFWVVDRFLFWWRRMLVRVITAPNRSVHVCYSSYSDVPWAGSRFNFSTRYCWPFPIWAGILQFVLSCSRGNNVGKLLVVRFPAGAMIASSSAPSYIGCAYVMSFSEFPPYFFSLLSFLTWQVCFSVEPARCCCLAPFDHCSFSFRLGDVVYLAVMYCTNFLCKGPRTHFTAKPMCPEIYLSRKAC